MGTRGKNEKVSAKMKVVPCHYVIEMHHATNERRIFIRGLNSLTPSNWVSPPNRTQRRLRTWMSYPITLKPPL